MPKKRNYRDERLRLQLLRQWREEHGDVCPGSQWCQPTPHHTRDLTVDHIKPQAHGGTLQDGWRILCRQANSRRADRTGTTPPSRNW